MPTEDKIIEKFLKGQNQLVFQSSDLSLGSIAEMVASAAIDINPKYQRRERWDVVKQSALIESFLLNIPVPPIFLAEDEYGRYSVIDGKQRITAISKFINEGLKLKDLERFKELEGYNFNLLPKPLNNALKIRPYIRVITLLKQSAPQLKYEVFTRLNTGGESLLPQEIRNVAFMGPLNDLIFELANNEFLRQQLKITNDNSKPYKEMLDAEYVLRFFTLRDMWNHFPGAMKDAMDMFMEKYQNCGVEKINSLRNIFVDSLEICEAIWGDDSFKRPDGDVYRNQILQGLYDVQLVPFSFFQDQKALILSKKQKIRDSFSEALLTDNVFQEAIRQFTSNPVRVQYRISKMIEVIKNAIS